MLWNGSSDLVYGIKGGECSKQRLVVHVFRDEFGLVLVEIHIRHIRWQGLQQSLGSMCLTKSFVNRQR